MTFERRSTTKSLSTFFFFLRGVGGGTYSVRDPLEPKPPET